jgi:hypothetical protein
MILTSVCQEIHRLLQGLPVCTDPKQVPFADGLYFFYESGETSEHGPDGRIVRVGNHSRSQGGLVRRLRIHYSGRKNSSVFRKFLGGALMRCENPKHPCLAPSPGKGHWECQDQKICFRCKPIEQQVSDLLRSKFRFRCVAIPNRIERNRFEEVLIASLAACTRCLPSPNWMGLKAYSDVVRESGLWNIQHVDGPTMTTDDLDRFIELTGKTART